MKMESDNKAQSQELKGVVTFGMDNLAFDHIESPITTTGNIYKSKSAENLQKVANQNGQTRRHSSLRDLVTMEINPGSSDHKNPVTRSSSLADVAKALGGRSTSLTDVNITGQEYLRQWRKYKNFLHPYGNSPTIFEQLLGEHDMSEFFVYDNQSPAKLIIWIIFTFVLLGIAGAIVLAAEMSRPDLSPLTNSTDPMF